MIWMCRDMPTWGHDDNRLCGRFKTEALKSNFGPVLNLSGSGLQLRSKRELVSDSAHPVEIVLRAHGSECRVKCMVVWCEKEGFRKYRVGLCYVNVETARPAINALLRDSVFDPGLGNRKVKRFDEDLAA